MPTDSRLGVALLSARHHQDYLSDAFAANRHCRIVAVGEEPDIPAEFRHLAPRLAERHRVPFVEDVAALLARPDVDVVSIGSEITRHGRLALQAIAAGKHVHIDKPMAATLAECRALAAAAAEAEGHGARVAVFSRCPAPAVQRARAALARGAIGQPLLARGDYVVTYGPGEVFDPVRDEQRFHPRWTGGGELMLHGVYPLTNLRYLLGQEFTSVQCFVGSLFNRYSREFGTDDTATLLLTTSGGVPVTVLLGRTHAPLHPGQADIGVRLVGSRGLLIADEQRPAVTVCGRPEVGLRELIADADPVQIMIDEFVDAIIAGRPLTQTVADSLRVMEACFAAEEAARTGRVVPLVSAASSPV